MQRILVIDDDAAVISILKRGLSYEGFRVVTAQSGIEGLAIERDNPADRILLDIMMPIWLLEILSYPSVFHQGTFT